MESLITLRGILLDQLRSTHNQAGWFAHLMAAVEGLTPEQASWKDPVGNHSTGQLVNHLLYWNLQELAKMKDEKPAAFNGNNDETFDIFEAESWKETVRKLDGVLSEIEKLVESASEETLNAWAPDVARIGTHNAYHIGQIVSVRKLQGSWPPAQGVK